MPLICDGCGQPVPIPEGYRRNKIQCACGVYCTVPESARASDEEPARPRPAAARSSAAEEEAERWLFDEPSPDPAARKQPDSPSEPPRFQDAEPAVEPPAPAKKAPAFERRFKCRRCGHPVRRQGECPSCDADKMPAATENEPVWWPSVDDSDEEEKEDSSPYAVEGADEVPCPKCSFRLPPGSVLCVRCGFHLKKRKKVAKTYQPIDRTWETNASLKGRRTLFAGCSIAFFVSGLVGVIHGGVGIGLFLCTYVVVTTMAAFLMGTFDTIHLTRDARGRAQLTKTWRVCFVAREPQRVDLRGGYEGIVSGRHRDITSWDYFLFFFLFVAGIVPGIIWYYFAIHKVTFHVSLSRDHGYPAYVVYSGWNEMQMKEIAYTLRDATGLRYEE
jgi:hypothetical protein